MWSFKSLKQLNLRKVNNGQFTKLKKTVKVSRQYQENYGS